MAREKGSAPSGATDGLPLWVRLWLLVSGLVCTWDATFILFRPHSLPGGKYHHLWKPYSIYVEVDKRYKDMGDPFVVAQSLMNLAEVVLCFVALTLPLFKAGRSTLLVTYSVSLMTLWKTVLYMLQYTELCGGGMYHSQNNAWTNFLYLWLPNGIWIFIPAAVCIRLAPGLLGSGIESRSGPTGKKRN